MTLRWRAYILHILVGVAITTLLCWLVGLVLGMVHVAHADGYILGPTFIVPILFGSIIGACDASRTQDPLAQWVWIPTALWMCLGVFESAKAPGGTLPSALVAYFGSNCGDSDCLGQSLVSVPFVSSITYSLGAYSYFRFCARLKGAKN